MGLFNRTRSLQTRSEETTTEPVPGSGVLPPPRYTDSIVTTDRALTLTSVFRSVSLIATSCGALTLDTWRNDDPIKAPSWVSKPDMKISRSRFFEETVTSLALNGNAYWRIVRDNKAAPINALIVLDPLEVAVNGDGTFGYKGKTLRDWEVEHLKFLAIPGRPKGLGPIQATQAALKSAVDLRDYAAHWFMADHIPTGILKSDKPINRETAKRYQDDWDARAGRGTAVLGEGLDYKPILLTPEESLWLEAQRFSVQDVARLFGIPAHLILAEVAGSSLTYQNLSQADLAFFRYTLSAYLRPIEEAISNLLPRGQVARFNLDAVLRPDTKTRYESHEIALRSGFLLKSEVRAIEGLPAIPGIDDREVAQVENSEVPGDEGL